MRIIIRAVAERAAMVDYLLSELPDAEVVWDVTRNALDTFLEALRRAGNEPAVHMEDDTLLTSNFRQKLTAAIEERPAVISQFFSMRKDDLTVGSRWDKNFLMGQCFYMPATYSHQLLDYSARWPGRAKHPTGLDTMLSDWLKERHESYWIHIPSLVEHRQVKSAIDSRRSSKRQSKTFQP
jgi:hypothetical protein